MKRALLLGAMTAMLQVCGCRLGERSAHHSASGRAPANSEKSGDVTVVDSTGHSATAVDSAGGAASAAAPDSAGAGNAPVLPIPDLGYNAREGRVLYRHYCLFCHGEEGAGDGFNAYNLDPRPRALADSTFQAGHTDDDLAAAIRSGGGAAGLSTGMPPWGRTLNERKIRNIVEFVRSLRTKTAIAR